MANAVLSKADLCMQNHGLVYKMFRLAGISQDAKSASQLVAAYTQNE